MKKSRIFGSMAFGAMLASGEHSMLCLMMFTARSEMSLVMILAIVANVLQDSAGSFVSLRVTLRVIKFQVASLNAGWCFSAKSRQIPGRSLFAMWPFRG